MSKSVNIAELKDRLSLYLNEVKAGREILVRDRNTPIARIVPITHAGRDEELKVLAVQGKIRLADDDWDESFWDLPAPRISRSVLRRTVERERDEA